MQTTEIVLVRHGETQSNLEQLLHGRTDVPLTPLGEWQAQRVAQRIAELGTFDLLLSSPLSRARSTAEQISRQIGLETIYLDDLTELHFGDFEGYTLMQLQDSHPELFLRALDFTDFELRFPNGESRREFHERVKRVFDEVLEQYAGKRLIIVTH